MNDPPVEILLVEDDPNDVELTLHALKKFNIVNSLHVLRDGAEALGFILSAGANEGRYVEGVL